MVDVPPTPVGAEDVRVLVPTGYGLNCEAETVAGFRAAGAHVESVHMGDLLERGAAALTDVHILVFIGGFAFGDHVSSGRVLANRLRARLGEALARHVDDGGLVLGVCNGFQTLAKLGLLPALGRGLGEPIAQQQVSLVANERLGYRDGWVRLRVESGSPCAFTRGLAGRILECPARHGEGKLVWRDAQVAAAIREQGLVPVRYVDAAGQPTERWPDNPNGSPDGAAGLCDATGRVFGLMPHPEAFLYAENHPRWREPAARPELLGTSLLREGVAAVLGAG